MGPTVVGSRSIWEMPRMVLPNGTLAGNVRWVPLADSLQLGMNMVVARLLVMWQPTARKLPRTGLLFGTGMDLIFLVALTL